MKNVMGGGGFAISASDRKKRTATRVFERAKGIRIMVWDLDTMRRLNADADEKRQLGPILLAAIVRSGFDLSPCGTCGEPVVCLPDGLPICEPCARDLDRTESPRQN